MGGGLESRFVGLMLEIGKTIVTVASGCVIVTVALLIYYSTFLIPTVNNDYYIVRFHDISRS